MGTSSAENKVLSHYLESGQVGKIVSSLNDNETANIHLQGLVGTATSMVIAACFKQLDAPMLLVFDEKEEAAYYLNDLEQLLDKERVLFYPGSYRRPYEMEHTSNANVLLRAEVLNRINSQKKPALIVSYSEALFEKVVTRKELEKNTQKLAVGDQLSIDFLNEVLFEYQFNRVDFVTEPGEFSVRGGIVDVFSFSHDEPYRIEFFGDEVDSIRTFDVESQLSEQQLKKITIIPNVADKEHLEHHISFLEYMSKKTVVVLKNQDFLQDALNTLYAKAETAFENQSNTVQQSKPEALFCNANYIAKDLLRFRRLHLQTREDTSQQVVFQTKPQPAFHQKFDLLVADFQKHHNLGFTNYIGCATAEQVHRFTDIFEEMDAEVHYQALEQSFYHGFIDEDLKILFYTDHQIFERYHKFNLRNGYAKKQAITLKQLNNLEIGDYVTHIDHGIGKYGGLQKIDVEGNKQEAIKLVYGDRDILYVSIHSLHKISKYTGKDGKVPKLYKLGSNAWKKLKQKTKSRVKQIAFSLIELYAKRRMKRGHQYGPDSYLQHELEASFLYEDTPDQSKATQEVKADMESERPMDRLVCGDVGFGKTEVAIRAAFKAVDNGKQVVILVPTTILAFQHYKTLSKRMKNFPVRVDYVNRFRTAKEKRLIYEDLANGQIDIVIGTHQLTNKKIRFKDLGLLIIDEEQKFGVAVKEKLKTIKENVDVLTLTATPIPRTLQFSLMAARDLSTINTAPPNRYPIESRVVRFNEEIIRDAVIYEMQRGGQVFFIHNRIENIREVAGMLQRLVPDAKIGIGHGQMEGKQLEERIFSFMNGEYDILVATTIVENGLDVPNANTIFINNANNFGLSDLHQMRGRVGRGNKKAFCFFITPPYSTMTPDARKRISALEQYTELGSGFNIAMKDLEIRGAGDILGGEQSGFINDIGFETYQKILKEAIAELKENEFSDLYEQPKEDVKVFVKDTQIDSDFELLYPDDYINNIAERLNLYNELSELKDLEALEAYKGRIKDRFGPLPTQAADLLKSVEIKWMAAKMGLERIVVKNGKCIGYFVADQQSAFYQSAAFTNILMTVQKQPKIATLKEKETRKGLRLLLVLTQISNVDQLYQRLEQLSPVTTNPVS
ncbi:MAG: transcription-repair coupling factor [Flavobacteriaceae bacterium]|nr:transcription-repair coupling factor [Flavobacteriaceae bacterium]